MVGCPDAGYAQAFLDDAVRARTVRSAVIASNRAFSRQFKAHNGVAPTLARGKDSDARPDLAGPRVFG